MKPFFFALGAVLMVAAFLTYSGPGQYFPADAVRPLPPSRLSRAKLHLARRRR